MLTAVTRCLPSDFLYQRLMLGKMLQYFDKGASPYGHQETDFERWLACTDTHCPAYEIKPESERFEPWGVLDRQQALRNAPYDEVYRGYGELLDINIPGGGGVPACDLWHGMTLAVGCANCCYGVLPRCVATVCCHGVLPRCLAGSSWAGQCSGAKQLCRGQCGGRTK
jgi:hypothetical protein